MGSVVPPSSSPDFWDKYYDGAIPGDNPKVSAPSSFAYFVSRWVRPGDHIIDVGCGNGRDASFFHRAFGCQVTGLDVSKSAVDSLPPYVTGICAPVSGLGRVDNNTHQYDVVYSRFALHSITPVEQETLFAWARSRARLLCIETRSVNDPRFGVGTPGDDTGSFVDTHYRRFTRLSDLTRSLQEHHGMRIIHAEEDFVSAAQEGDRAVVNRIICAPMERRCQRGTL